MKVVFIAGPFRGVTPWDVEEHIRVAERAALMVWRFGAAALCPHTNTRFFDKALPDDVFLAGTRELLRRTDAVLAVGDWSNSRGTCDEIEFAHKLGVPVFYHLEALQKWLAQTTNV